MATGAAIASAVIGAGTAAYQVDQGKKEKRRVQNQQKIESDIAEAERLQDAKTANQESASITLGTQDGEGGKTTSLAKPQAQKKQQQATQASGVGLRV